MRIQPLLAAALALFAASAAQAIERYNSQAMSCASVQATIRADGAAIMRYASKSNPSLTLFDRYVSNGSFCPSGQEAVPAWIPSKDDATCPVLRCRDREFELEDRFDNRDDNRDE